jgi:hypothetical protein
VLSDQLISVCTRNEHIIAEIAARIKKIMAMAAHAIYNQQEDKKKHGWQSKPQNSFVAYLDALQCL